MASIFVQNIIICTLYHRYQIKEKMNLTKKLIIFLFFSSCVYFLLLVRDNWDDICDFTEYSTPETTAGNHSNTHMYVKLYIHAYYCLVTSLLE